MNTHLSLRPEPYVWSEPPLGDAKSAPTRFYTDPAVFKAEMEHIHLKTWFFAGRVEDIPKPGDYKAIDTVGGPALLVRGEQGVLRAFANVYRHRASILLQGVGNTKRINCPYHAWNYLLDGTLAGAPGMREVPKFEKPPHGLIRIRMEIWEGAIFLNYDDATPDLTTYFGNYPDLIGSHRFGEMVRTYLFEVETRCNWKLLLETPWRPIIPASSTPRPLGPNAASASRPPANGSRSRFSPRARSRCWGRSRLSRRSRAYPTRRAKEHSSR